jgi:UPF0716 protein FxsA
MWIIILGLVAFVAIEVTTVVSLVMFIGKEIVIAEAILTFLLGALVVGYWWFYYYRVAQGRFSPEGEDSLARQVWEVNGLLILLAGVFLIVPGLVTGFLGLLLLLPPVRRFVIGKISGTLPP